MIRDELRAAGYGDVVPVMAGRTQREIRDQDVQGLKYLRKLRRTRPHDPRQAERAASVISDEIVAMGWKSRHRTRPDHPVWLICVAVKPHESYVSSPIGSICRHLFSDKHHGVEIQA